MPNLFFNLVFGYSLDICSPSEEFKSLLPQENVGRCGVIDLISAWGVTRWGLCCHEQPFTLGVITNMTFCVCCDKRKTAGHAECFYCTMVMGCGIGLLGRIW